MMNQCVPSWALNEPPSSPKFSLPVNSDAASTAPSFDPMLDYEVAELTWENGHIVMHGLGPPRTVLGKLPTKGTWEKPRANGTLESIVSQATKLTSDMKQPQTPGTSAAADLLVPWFNDRRSGLDSVTMTLDALVPGTCGNGSSTRVDSYSGVRIACVDNGREEMKRARVAVVPVAACEGSSKNYGSANRAGGDESAPVGVDTDEIEVGTGLTSTSLSLHRDSHMTPIAVDERESVSHSGTQEKEERRSKRKGKGKLEEEKENIQKSSVPTKRSRAAAVHNQSERKRRDKINQKMKTLQKLVPNSSKTDKASMLDEVIEYLKQLQAQVQMMSRMGIPNMMMSMTMQQQLQMSMMAQMGFMGMMDQMNPMARPGGFATIPPQVLNPAAFLPSLPSWDGAASSDHRLPSVPTGTLLPDPFSSFLASQQQPLNMEAYNRMAALYHQQLNSQPSRSGAKS